MMYLLLMTLGVLMPNSWDAYGYLADETEITGTLLTDICDHLIQAGVLQEGQTVVTPQTTSSVFRIIAYRRKRTAEAILAPEMEVLKRIEDVMNNEAPELPIEVPQAITSCRFARAESSRSVNGPETAPLALSAPILTPSYRSDMAVPGLFVSVSTGPKQVDWFWVRLRMPGGRFSVDGIHRLDIES